MSCTGRNRRSSTRCSPIMHAPHITSDPMMQPTTGRHVGTAAIPNSLPIFFLQIECLEPSPIVGHANLLGCDATVMHLKSRRVQAQMQVLAPAAAAGCPFPPNKQCNTARTERTVCMTPCMNEVLAAFVAYGASAIFLTGWRKVRCASTTSFDKSCTHAEREE